MMSKLAAAFAIFTFSASPLNAEYRAYQYAVVNKVLFQGQKKTSVVVSTLNPSSYISYNGGARLVNVDLLRTWICPGHTANKNICPSPYTEMTGEDAP